VLRTPIVSSETLIIDGPPPEPLVCCCSHTFTEAGAEGGGALAALGPPIPTAVALGPLGAPGAGAGPPASPGRAMRPPHWLQNFASSEFEAPQDWQYMGRQHTRPHPDVPAFVPSHHVRWGPQTPASPVETPDTGTFRSRVLVSRPSASTLFFARLGDFSDPLLVE
jgi:hypothetical protein